MPYLTDPEELCASTQARALVALWQSDLGRDDLPDGEELALWWIDQDSADLNDEGPRPGRCGRKWGQLARHGNLWAYIHGPQNIDLIGMELGIENDWIPKPGLSFDAQDRLVTISWTAPLHLYARPPRGFGSWRLPLARIGYERPDRREAPLPGAQQERVHANGSWWC